MHEPCRHNHLHKIELCDDSLADDDPPKHAGDLVCIALDQKPGEGQLCGVVIGSQLLVRYVYFLAGGVARFEARHSAHRPLRKKLSHVYILGVILCHHVAGTALEEVPKIV